MAKWITKSIYEDNIEDLYEVPDWIKPYIETLDNLITESAGTDLHYALVENVWVPLLEEYRIG